MYSVKGQRLPSLQGRDGVRLLIAGLTRNLLRENKNRDTEILHSSLFTFHLILCHSVSLCFIIIILSRCFS